LIKKSSRFVTLIPNWNDQNLGIMKNILRIKFSKELYKTLLINTGDQYIQEGNYWEDKYWGVCLKTNQGENHLGKIIMDIRKEIIE
jgi:predicted NAD-dependent protein-ADP-ribosyltransferase YbiA (DUF1768 family)